MKFKTKTLPLLFLIAVITPLSAQEVSKSWVADLGNGMYKNPVLFADYSDPDVCRVGTDYYMTASSFNCIPGLPILHSKDLVNWQLIGHAIDRLKPESVFSGPQHGNGVWAPAIRYRNDEFYVYYGDPDFGIFVVKTKDPAGKWEEPILVKEGRGLIDPCPLWDDDGRVYLVHAYAGSRAGIKSILSVAEMNAEGTRVIAPSRIVYDGHDLDPTVEGAKFHKRNGYYYIFAPAGGVATGWQAVFRSKNVYGPYERKIVLAQGTTNVNGPHQGAWIDTAEGEDWFFHFQDAGAFGRIVHLQPMRWDNDWPLVGVNLKNGIGEPAAIHVKPKVNAPAKTMTPLESDWFESGRLGLQWQWHANPQDWWYFADAGSRKLHLYSVPVPEDYVNLWNVPNLLLQKFPSNNFSATVKLTFLPSDAIAGERTGLLVMGMDYGLLSLEKTKDGFILSQNECLQADRGSKEVVNESVRLSGGEVFLRVSVNPDALCTFSYSVDGRTFKPLGQSFKAKEGRWIGAKVGLFCSRPVSNNDGGRAVVDWFVIQ